MTTRSWRPRIIEKKGCLRRYESPAPARSSVLCFPWAGAGASAYRDIASHIPDGMELLAVQYPGREDRYNEPPVHDMRSLVGQVLGDLVDLWDKPVIFFGHSMGALVAYEVAAALELSGLPAPRLLVVSGCGSPAKKSLFKRCQVMASVKEFISDIRALGGTPREVLDNEDILRLMVPVLRADYHVLDGYRCKADRRVSCPLLACSGNTDPSVSEDTLGNWSEFTSGPWSIHWFEGDHFYLRECPRSLVDHLWSWSHGPEAARQSHSKSVLEAPGEARCPVLGAASKSEGGIWRCVG